MQSVVSHVDGVVWEAGEAEVVAVATALIYLPMRNEFIDIVSAIVSE